MKDKIVTLIIKLIFTFFVAWLSFGYIGSNTLSWIIITTLAVAIINYFIGDLIILPSFSNIVASIVDGLTSAITALLISLLAGGFKPNNQMVDIFRTNLFTLAFFAIAIAVIEYFFHIFLLQSNKVSSKKDYYK